MDKNLSLLSRMRLLSLDVGPTLIQGDLILILALVTTAKTLFTNEVAGHRYCELGLGHVFCKRTQFSPLHGSAINT